MLPLLHPEVYSEVMRGTRRKDGEPPHARSILFEGPPGFGKALLARAFIQHHFNIH